jgi:hypothetical protein
MKCGSYSFVDVAYLSQYQRRGRGARLCRVMLQRPRRLQRYSLGVTIKALLPEQIQPTKLIMRQLQLPTSPKGTYDLQQKQSRISASRHCNNVRVDRHDSVLLCYSATYLSWLGYAFSFYGIASHMKSWSLTTPLPLNN